MVSIFASQVGQKDMMIVLLRISRIIREYLLLFISLWVICFSSINCLHFLKKSTLLSSVGSFKTLIDRSFLIYYYSFVAEFFSQSSLILLTLFVVCYCTEFSYFDVITLSVV